MGSSIAWSWTGGLRSYVPSSKLAPCASYTHRRDGSDNSASCTVDMSACQANGIGGADVAVAMGNADVKAALAGNVDLYGSDPRGCDGAVLDITIVGRTIEVGGDCSLAGQCGGSSACTPVPKGLGALADLLEKLDEQELALQACAATR